MKIFPCNLRHWIIILFISSLALPPYAAAQQPSDDDDYQGTVNPSMAVIVIVLVCAFFITGCFSIFIQQCSSSSSYGVSIAGVVASAGGRSRRGNKRGVDRSVIDTFPTFDYAAVMEKKIGKGALECAVCLSEFEKEDTIRLLPKCDHVFHADCIDAWLVNHATCPVCRANLIPDSDELAKPNESIQINEEQHESASSDSIPRSRSEHSVRIAIESDQTAIVIPKLPRSHSTGHSLIQPGVDCERFKLRLPEEVRKQIMSRAKLNRTRSLVNLPRVSSSRRGYRNGCGGEGSGSSRYRRLFGRSGRWPSFIARNVSFKSPKGDAAAGSDSKKYLTAVVAPLERLGVKEGTTSSQTVLPV